MLNRGKNTEVYASRLEIFCEGLYRFVLCAGCSVLSILHLRSGHCNFHILIVLGVSDMLWLCYLIKLVRHQVNCWDVYCIASRIRFI